MPLNLGQAQEAADRLCQARLSLIPIEALPSRCRPTDEADGYLVQTYVHERLTTAGRGQIIGHKIGCTTTVMQEYLGISNPCAGAVFEPTVHQIEGVVEQSQMLRIGVECEIAVVLGASLDDEQAFEGENLEDSIESIAAAIEIVEDRYADYPSLDTPTLVSDDFFGAGCVLGPAVTAWRELDLAGVRASMAINGETVGSGVGADILGHPLEALRWLAAHRIARREPLVAGEFVLLGSLVATHWVAQGDVIAVSSPVLGDVTARIV